MDNSTKRVAKTKSIIVSYEMPHELMYIVQLKNLFGAKILVGYDYITAASDWPFAFYSYIGCFCLGVCIHKYTYVFTFILFAENI